VRKRPLTLIGSPTIRAQLAISGAIPSNTEIAARLFDVSPDGTRRLVARGLYRPAAQGRALWHLHPAAWKFIPGHRIELQLLGADPPYSRPSNFAFETVVSGLRLRLPLRQRR
jgi:predicted acyl esterase